MCVCVHIYINIKYIYILIYSVWIPQVVDFPSANPNLEQQIPSVASPEPRIASSRGADVERESSMDLGHPSSMVMIIAI